MQMRVNRIFWILLVFLTACNSKLEKLPGNSGIIPAFSRDQISFALVKQYLFDLKCLSCHRALGQVDLGVYAKALASLNAIENDVFVRKTMPKSPEAPLSEDEKRILSTWIEAGAPEFPGGGSSPPPVLEPIFENIKTNIFGVKCLQCHNPNGRAKNIPLDTISDLTEGMNPLVEAGNPEGSYLAIVLKPGARKFMPPLDSGVTRVTQSELNIIKEWIQNGAKD